MHQSIDSAAPRKDSEMEGNRHAEGERTFSFPMPSSHNGAAGILMMPFQTARIGQEAFCIAPHSSPTLQAAALRPVPAVPCFSDLSTRLQTATTKRPRDSHYDDVSYTVGMPSEFKRGRASGLGDFSEEEGEEAVSRHVARPTAGAKAEEASIPSCSETSEDVDMNEEEGADWDVTGPFERAEYHQRPFDHEE